MNADVHSSDFDSLLVVLPDSAITPEGIRLLSEISKCDHFIIQNKLKMKLPHILCPVNASDVAGTSGDLMASLHINFIAVRKKFFKLPFQPFPVVSCRFGKKQSRFFSSDSSFLDIYNEEKILLIEGRYQTTDVKVASMAGDDMNNLLKQQKVKAVHSMDVRAYRFVMLYQIMDPDPFVFIDRGLDYSFLESEKKMTVSDNFNALKKQLEKTFCCRINTAMRQHEYLLHQAQNISAHKEKGINLKPGKNIITTEISNETAANRMSRLLLFQWCKENGWVDRIMPQVS